MPLVAQIDWTAVAAWGQIVVPLVFQALVWFSSIEPRLKSMDRKLGKNFHLSRRNRRILKKHRAELNDLHDVSKEHGERLEDVEGSVHSIQDHHAD